MGVFEISGILEEKIVSYTHPRNNTYPLWCYGAPLIVRDGEDVIVSIPETGENELPFMSTRIRLMRKSGSAPWETAYVSPKYDQREPCPIARRGAGKIALSINTGITPFREGPGPNGHEIKWYCEPYMLSFDKKLAFPELMKPRWEIDWPFTDHSYRGFAACPETGEAFMLQLEGYLWKPGYLGRYHWSYLNEGGEWSRCGIMTFPRRLGYAMLAVNRKSACVCGTTILEEPVKEWADFKLEVTGHWWDYDFRYLYYTVTPDIESAPFCEPVVVDEVEDTCGVIWHHDMHVEDDGTVYILYSRKNFWKYFMRDRYHPDVPIRTELCMATLKDGKVLSRQVLYACVEDKDSPYCCGTESPMDSQNWDGFAASSPLHSDAAFSKLSDGRLFAVYNLSGFSGPGSAKAGNYLRRILPELSPEPFRLEAERPLHKFYAASRRIGSEPCMSIDLYGVPEQASPDLLYMRIDFPADAPERG